MAYKCLRGLIRHIVVSLPLQCTHLSCPRPWLHSFVRAVCRLQAFFNASIFSFTDDPSSQKVCNKCLVSTRIKYEKR